MKLSNLLLLICFTTLVAIPLQGCNSESQPLRIIPGPVTAYYEIQVSPSSTAGTGTDGAEFSEIHIFDHHIIALRKGESGGALFPLSKIKSFRWKKKAK